MTAFYTVAAILLGVSWLFSLALALFVGQTLAFKAMAAQRQAIFDKIFEYLEGVKNGISNNK